LTGAAIAAVVTEIVRFAAAIVLAEAEGYSAANPFRLLKPLVAAGAMAAVISAVSFGVAAEVVIGGAVYLAVLAALGGFRFRAGTFPEIVL
jgi:hypothetical protein